MRLAALFSGGKDSNFAVYLALNQGWSVNYLITLNPGSVESLYWHYPAVEWSKLQSEAMGIPQIVLNVSGRNEIGKLEETLIQLKRIGVNGLLSGVISSDYQRDKLLELCHRVGLKLVTPLWQKKPIKIVEKMLKIGFDIVIVGVAAYGLDRSWIGRTLNEDLLFKLKMKWKKLGIDVCGEGGEFETFVCDAPHFKGRIKINRHNVFWERYSGFMRIEDAEITPKSL
ncbi:MAG: diphthine--ammonia ligase [archaeon GB-1867-097]|nr:diphthine--ammonia ligase [Candidatus Culexmicrobium thermophilum]MCS7384198.1 diphthine--ammonia ligase [Candidatus Culexmicrobium thermophilum]HDO20928.1 diphthine--ammonia ligase [Candidatus Bathyarchaeota archaeon]